MVDPGLTLTLPSNTVYIYNIDMSDNIRRPNAAFAITVAHINSEADPPLWLLACYRIILLTHQSEYWWENL